MRTHARTHAAAAAAAVQCEACVVDGLAIENGQQRAIVLHGTHLATLRDDVISGVRGASIYIEDGNEMYDRIDLVQRRGLPVGAKRPEVWVHCAGHRQRPSGHVAQSGRNMGAVVDQIKSRHRDSHVSLLRLSVSRCCGYPPAPRIGVNLCAAGDQQCLLLRLAVPPLNAIGSTDLAR